MFHPPNKNIIMSKNNRTSEFLQESLLAPCIIKVPFGSLPEERKYMKMINYSYSRKNWENIIKNYITDIYPSQILLEELLRKSWKTIVELKPQKNQKKSQQITLIPIKFPKEMHGKTINEFTCVFYKDPTQEVLIKIKFNRENTLEAPYITEIKVIQGNKELFKEKKVSIKTIENRWIPEDIKIVLQVK